MLVVQPVGLDGGDEELRTGGRDEKGEREKEDGDKSWVKIKNKDNKNKNKDNSIIMITALSYVSSKKKKKKKKIIIITRRTTTTYPLVPGPALAIDKIPGAVCFSLKFSSSKLPP